MMFTCEICIEPCKESKQFTNKSNCSHPFCKDCIKEYIQIKIKEKRGGGIIECPGLNCKNYLDPSSCRSIIGPTLFLKWCDLLLERAIPWPDSSFCPNKDCLELVVNECGGSVTESTCPNCKEVFCFQCSRKWPGNGGRNHKCRGRNGEGSEMNDVLFMRLMKRKRWVKCPGCGLCIEHHGGCASMKCIRCSTSFCYKCGRNTCVCRQMSGFDVRMCCVVFLLILILFVGLGSLLFLLGVLILREIEK